MVTNIKLKRSKLATAFFKNEPSHLQSTNLKKYANLTSNCTARPSPCRVTRKRKVTIFSTWTFWCPGQSHRVRRLPVYTKAVKGYGRHRSQSLQLPRAQYCQPPDTLSRPDPKNPYLFHFIFHGQANHHRLALGSPCQSSHGAAKPKLQGGTRSQPTGTGSPFNGKVHAETQPQLLHRYRPVADYGLLGNLYKPWIGDPTTTTYHATVTLEDGTVIRGLYETAQIAE